MYRENFSAYDYSLVRQAFEVAVGSKLFNDGYYNMSEFLSVEFTMHDMRERLQDSFVHDLYKQPLQKDVESSEKIFAQFSERYGGREQILSEIEAKAILLWVFRGQRTVADRRGLFRKFIDFSKETKSDFRESGSIVFDSNRVDLRIVDSVSKFSENIKELKEISSGKLFFRGHSKLNMMLIPSIMRRDAWDQNERRMYNELKMRCTDEFMNVKTHLETLVKMQHYELPTRLFDITTNPLVALYFASENQEDKLGEVLVFDVTPDEIKYPNSDSVAILASLPLFKYDEQQEIYTDSLKMTLADFNKKHKRLLHEIKQEKPAFRDIINPETVRENFFVMSDKNNKRIIKQDGEFIICGLSDNKYRKNNELFRLRARADGKTIVLVCDKKRNILEELDTYSINSATLFPEIENVAGYVKKHVG